MMTPADGEIYGLRATSNGRSCVQHDPCGAFLQPNDIVRFVFVYLYEDDKDKIPEPAIKAVVVKDGTELCTVGFLPRNYASVEYTRKKYDDQFAQIIELYDLSESEVLRKKSHRNMGIASFRLLGDVLRQE
jgi:hypothetical protein